MEVTQNPYDNLNFLVRSFFAVSTLLVLLSRSNGSLFCYTLYGKRLKYYNRRDLSKYTVPKSCFSNFYLLGLLLNLYLFYKEHRVFLNAFRLMFISHVTRRLLEQIVLFTRLPKPSVMHLGSYLFGLSFYVATAFALNTPSTFLPFRLALLLNVLAQVLQFYTHCKLSDMRKGGSDERTFYKVPKGGPFNLVLCPHYLAEVLLYISFCCNTNMLFCLVFVTVELATLARSNRKWYRDNFPKTELKTDKALVPFLF